MVAQKLLIAFIAYLIGRAPMLDVSQVKVVGLWILLIGLVIAQATQKED